MAGSTAISIRQTGAVGRITLTRPQALNALTGEMLGAIGDALRNWEASGTVRMVLLDAEGDRAFCAGGDVAEMYRLGLEGNFASARQFFADEYRVNAQVAECSLPYVAIMDGIVMGGGVGIGGHASNRIVTERSMVAMPECAIGLVPDVGGSFLLSRAPGHMGEFLAMTGWRMTGADAIFAGFADVMVKSGNLANLKIALEHHARPAEISKFVTRPEAAPLTQFMDAINTHFSKATALECVLSLEADPSDFAQKAAEMIRRGCPLSVASTFEMVRAARGLSSIRDALSQEYRFTARALSDGQMIEGVRAQIIDKDRKPKWRPARLEELDPQAVAAMLAPLGADELAFEIREDA